MKIFSAALFAFAMAVSTASVAAVIWDEARDSDLSDDFLFPTNVGLLQIGESSIHGSVGVSLFPGRPPQFDLDFFSFSIGLDEHLSSASVSWDDATLGTSSGSLNWLVFLPPASRASTADGVRTFTATPPHDFPSLGAATARGLQFDGDQQNAWQWTEGYTVHLNVIAAPRTGAVSSVSEPSPLFLMLSALIAVAIARRRKPHWKAE